jgi:NAD(P)H-flavin reductase
METLIQSPMTPCLYRIKKIIRENHDTFSLDLTPKDGSETIAFQPGQFNMLYVFGVGEVPISVSGPKPGVQGLIHTIREMGAATQALGRLKKGDTVGLRGPFGRPGPIATSKGNDIVIMAGGIGLAPLRSALYALLDQRDQFGEIALLYGARSPKDLIFTKEFETWRGKFGVQVKVTVDTADSGWQGNVGIVTALIPRVSFEPAHTIAMICGPEIMMRHSALELICLGVSEDRIYIMMERNMKCAVGFCGHCQFGPTFICKDGPVFRYDRIKPFLRIREI